jgi:transposase
MDEKPSIQALERAQGYLKLPNGRALTGQSHDYKRHGTTTLFAALEVATGKIIATHSKRRRRVEFLEFMNSVAAAYPRRQLHVILDNLNTHKKNEHWLKAHPNVQFHFTPTSASWLNQVEVWFSILQGQSLSGASFTNLKQLEEHIDAYISAYNQKLKDKNGKDIYEGDILRTNRPSGLNVGFVRENHGMFVIKYSDIVGLKPVCKGGAIAVEVIGNIYEHPYLLTNEK